MDVILLRAWMDSIEKRLGKVEKGAPSRGTRGSLSRPIIDGGKQPDDVRDQLGPARSDPDDVDQAAADQVGQVDEAAKPKRKRRGTMVGGGRNKKR